HRHAHAFRFAAEHRLRGMRHASLHTVSARTAAEPVCRPARLRAHRRRDQPARLDRPDDPRYPRLKDALATAKAADLGEGDAIYIPPLWWHHVESLEQL